MYRLAIAMLVSSSISGFADSCPRLEGTFRCRSAEPFDLSIGKKSQNGVTVYEMTDPKGARSVLVDGQPHEMTFQTGKGEYRATCEGNSLIIEARSPEAIVLDRYYIERAAIVRIRLNKTTQKASSLSCSPTQGTWKLYEH